MELTRRVPGGGIAIGGPRTVGYHTPHVRDGSAVALSVAARRRTVSSAAEAVGHRHRGILADQPNGPRFRVAFEGGAPASGSSAPTRRAPLAGQRPKPSFEFGLFDFGIHAPVHMMRKSVHTRDYATFLELLIEVRRRSGVTQAQLGQQLPFEQPAISKIERGERRIDVIELKMICDCLGVTLSDFTRELEERFSKEND